MRFLQITSVILLFSALLMPWCWGYLKEAGRLDMAEAAQIFGWTCIGIAMCLLMGSVMFKDFSK